MPPLCGHRGNNVDSYGGGYAHHIYIGGNSIAQVWGNDREVMTYGTSHTARLPRSVPGAGNAAVGSRPAFHPPCPTARDTLLTLLFAWLWPSGGPCRGGLVCWLL